MLKEINQQKKNVSFLQRVVSEGESSDEESDVPKPMIRRRKYVSSDDLNN